MSVRISVIVPVYNSARYLPVCIASLLAQDYPRDQFEIIMVDNNSTDRSAAIIAGFPKVKLVAETKQSSYAARNHGVALAAGSILAFTDSDCAVAKDWLRHIESAMQEPEIQVVLGERLPPRVSTALSVWFDYERAKADYVFHSRQVDLYYGHTNNMGVRRTAFERFGPFLERSRGSDTVFVSCVAAGSAPNSVAFRSDIRVTHLELDRLFKLYVKKFLYGRSRGATLRLGASRALSTTQRLNVYWRTIKEHNYGVAKSLLLAGMLFGGLTAWGTGMLLGKWEARGTRRSA